MGRENLDYEKRRIGSGPELILIPCIILAASGPIISSARGGALVMAGLLILASVSMIFLKVRSNFLRLSTSIAIFAGLGSAFLLGWDKLEPRLINIFSDNMSNRTQIFEVALRMINEYPIFGSGPGSFEAIAQFELGETFSSWVSWVHNDYLEFYLTFGKLGGAILIALTVILALQFLATFLEGSARSVKWFALLAIIGVTVHAILDFPLQVYSILDHANIDCIQFL